MRGKKAPKRQVNGDRKYGNVHVTKLINAMMLKGKKGLAEDMVYHAITKGTEMVSSEDKKGTKTKEVVSEIEFFTKIIEHTSPSKKVVGRRVGGSTYQVPKEIPTEDRPLRAVKLISKSARDLAWEKGIKIADALLQILVDAYKNAGSAVAKKDALHDMADKNLAFQHFRW